MKLCNLLVLGLFLGGIALVLPGAAFAQNASTAGTPELYPTFNSIGLRVPYTGDANANAVAHLEWRFTGQATWRRGVDMTRITNSRWAGSVLWLPADTSVDVRAVIEDPDGGATATGSVRTRAEWKTTAVATTRWVATNGLDTNPGTSGAPLATLQAAANVANPGDEIRVRPGIYYQTLHGTRAGSAAARIHVVADAPGVILDGSDPAYLHAGGWSSVGGGVYAIAYTGATRLVCADSLQRLYRQASLADLQANANGMTQGYALESGNLYVKLEDGSSPVGHTMHVARYDNGVFLEASHWRVSGLEVRHYGVGAAAAGVYLRAANDCWIEKNYVHTCGGRGILLRVGSADDLIENNLVLDPRVGGWPWNATKSHDEEITGISNRGGRGNVVRTNTVQGYFDGLDANDGTTDENVAADYDVQGNTVTGCGDDAIETDTVSGLNLRLWDNDFDSDFNGFSLAPIYQGPEYVLFNTVTDYRRSAFKFSLSGVGHAWICHNTTSSDVSGTTAVWPTGPYSNMHFRDNILTGNGMPAVNDDAGESQSGNDFDGDLLYATGTTTLFHWNGAYYSSLSALRTGTGFEAHGRSGNPMFVAPGTGNYNLQTSSPALDGGLALPGIDDCYQGAAPDMGAGESCGPSEVTAVAVAMVSADARPDLVTVVWYSSGESFLATVWRRAGNAPWAPIGSLAPDGTGRLVLEDRDVVAGGRYGYRLVATVDGVEQTFGETWVDVPTGPALELLGARPNPAVGPLVIAFALPDASGGTLEVLDVAGRRVVSRSLAGLSPGTHVLGLDPDGRLAPGVYLIRLTQGGRAVTSRVSVVR